MILLFLSALISSKQVNDAGSYTDFIESSLTLTFNPKSKQENFLIITNPNEFTVGNKSISSIYRNPTEITFKGSNQEIHYIYLTLLNDCDYIDIIVNAGSIDKISWKANDLTAKTQYCLAFINQIDQNYTVFRSEETNPSNKLYVYPSLTMENGGNKQNVKNEIKIQNRNAIILSFTTNSNSIAGGTEIGITEFEGEKSSNPIKFYYAPGYNHLCNPSAPIISTLNEFEYGPRKIKLTNDHQIIEIPAGTYLTFSNADQTCNGRAFSGLNSFDFLGFTKIIAVSFKTSGYIELWSSANNKNKELNYIAFKNSSFSSCNEVITIMGQVSYKSKFSPFTNYCIYAGISKGKISISDVDKSVKFYKSDGTPYQYKKGYTSIPIQLVISPKAYDDKIKFSVKDKESNKEIVIRNGRQIYMSYTISDEFVANTNALIGKNDDSFNFDGIPLAKILLIIVGFAVFIIVLGILFISLFVCSFMRCCRRKPENSDTTTSSVTQTHVPLSSMNYYQPPYEEDPEKPKIKDDDDAYGESDGNDRIIPVNSSQTVSPYANSNSLGENLENSQNISNVNPYA